MKTIEQVLSTGPWETKDGPVTADQARAWFDALPDKPSALAALGATNGTDRRWDQTAQRFKRAGLVRCVRVGISSTFERVCG